MTAVIGFYSKEVLTLVKYKESWNNFGFSRFPDIIFQLVAIFLHDSWDERIVRFSCGFKEDESEFRFMPGDLQTLNFSFLFLNEIKLNWIKFLFTEHGFGTIQFIFLLFRTCWNWLLTGGGWSGFWQLDVTGSFLLTIFLDLWWVFQSMTEWKLIEYLFYLCAEFFLIETRLVVSVGSFGLLEVLFDELLVELGNRSKTEGRRGKVPDVFKDKIRL